MKKFFALMLSIGQMAVTREMKCAYLTQTYTNQ